MHNLDHDHCASTLTGIGGGMSLGGGGVHVLEIGTPSYRERSLNGREATVREANLYVEKCRK